MNPFKAIGKALDPRHVITGVRVTGDIIAAPFKVAHAINKEQAAMADPQPSQPPVDIVKVVEDATPIVQTVAADPKNFYKSKRFWSSAVAFAAMYGGLVSPQVAMGAAVAANVVWPLVDKLWAARSK